MASGFAGGKRLELGAHEIDLADIGRIEMGDDGFLVGNEGDEAFGGEALEGVGDRDAADAQLFGNATADEGFAFGPASLGDCAA